MTKQNTFKILPNAKVSNLYFVDSNQKNGQRYQYIEEISACPIHENDCSWTNLFITFKDNYLFITFKDNYSRVCHQNSPALR